MIRTRFRLFFLPLMMTAGFGQAIAEDTTAVLQISGTVKPETFSCAVMLNESSVSLLEKMDTLIKQGDEATNPILIHISVDRTNRHCAELADEGKIAFKVLGNADATDVDALANSLTDETAATGVAIGVFDSVNKPFAINSGMLPLQEDTTIGIQMVQLMGQEAVPGNINTMATVQIERL